MKFLLIPIYFIFLYSCTGQKIDKLKKIKFDFYLNESDGNIVLKKYFIQEVNSRFVTDSFYDPYVYFNRHDSTIKSLISYYIDTPTIHVIDPQRTFYADKKFVYYFHSTSDGGDLYLINDADPETFDIICNGEFGYDNKNVFYRNEKLKYLIPNAVKCLIDSSNLTNNFYIKDSTNVYFQSKRIDSADAKTFQLFTTNGCDAKDKYHFYKQGEITSIH